MSLLGHEYDIGHPGIGVDRFKKNRFRTFRRTYLRIALAPSNLVASAITSISCTLTWANTEPRLEGLRTRVDRRRIVDSFADGWTIAADFTPDNQDTNISGLLSDTTYDFRLYHYEEGRAEAKYRSPYNIIRVTTAP